MQAGGIGNKQQEGTKVLRKVATGYSFQVGNFFKV